MLPSTLFIDWRTFTRMRSSHTSFWSEYILSMRSYSSLLKTSSNSFFADWLSLTSFLLGCLSSKTLFFCLLLLYSAPALKIASRYLLDLPLVGRSFHFSILYETGMRWLVFIASRQRTIIKSSLSSISLILTEEKFVFNFWPTSVFSVKSL